jgi:hypothetical protein
LSYAIQNFYNVNQSLVLNQKLFLSWVFRNINLMVTLMKKNANTLFKTFLYRNSREFLLEIFQLFFNPGLHKIFKCLVSRWRPLLGTNYTQSLEYWTFKVGISSIEDNAQSNSLLKTNNKLFFNQYFTNIVLSNISLHNKYYRTVLVKFLQLLLVNWQLWKKTYNVSFQYVIVNKNYHLIRCYNKYFFKMYGF